MNRIECRNRLWEGSEYNWSILLGVEYAFNFKYVIWQGGEFARFTQDAESS